MSTQQRTPSWPGEQLCNTCFYTAMRTYGICPICGHDGVLPGRANHTDPRPVCLACAGIPEDYQCRTCHTEGQIYRHGRCARCALREDITSLIVHGAADPAAMGTIVEILCGVDRPESILTWKRSPTVRALLTGLSCGDIPLSHDGLDAAGRSRQVSHLRSLLEHNGLLPPRDEHLARFDSWLAHTLDDIPDSAIRAPVEQFATWHHLRRLRRNSTPGQASDGPRRSAQQQITETIKFLTWLHHTHHRTAATCRQQDVDEWLATGPTTRHKIRAFFAWAKKSKINTAVRLENQQAKTSRLLTQDQRLAWIKELLTGDTESLPYRVAGTLVLLYAQPLVKIAALKTTAIDITPHETLISLGAEPIPVPEPFPGMLKDHLNNRPSLRTGGGMAPTPWLFPGHRPGKHLDTQTMLSALGISVLGARNSALRNLIAEIPPPVVANLLGYSHNCTSTMRNGQVTDGLDTSHRGKVRALVAAQRGRDHHRQCLDHVGDPGPLHQQTPPLAPPRVGHHNRGSSRRAAFCAPSKHPLAVRYYEYGQMEYGGLPVVAVSVRALLESPAASYPLTGWRAGSPARSAILTGHVAGGSTETFSFKVHRLTGIGPPSRCSSAKALSS